MQRFINFSYRFSILGVLRPNASQSFKNGYFVGASMVAVAASIQIIAVALRAQRAMTDYGRFIDKHATLNHEFCREQLQAEMDEHLETHHMLTLAQEDIADLLLDLYECRGNAECGHPSHLYGCFLNVCYLDQAALEHDRT